LVPNRHGAIEPNFYRYGFQGQEKDDEIKGGEGKSLNYTFRMHDPRVGRFFAPDPLEKKYPFYSPYQFSGNRVIDMVELEGLEPAKNPKTPGVKEIKAAIVVEHIKTGAKVNDEVENIIAYIKDKWNSSNNLNLEGIWTPNTNEDNYVTDTDINKADKFNMYVSQNSVFKVDESNADKFDNYEAFIVGTIMKGFAEGTGPENYIFPENGIISSQFLDSDIVKSALEKFNKGEMVQNLQIPFGFNELIKDTDRNGTIFNITGLVGSGQITITKTANAIKIKIFNITSLSSGDLFKIPSKESTWSRSYVRDSSESTVTPYGNISQTFQLSLPLK
jgi:RHS repeat-associated protein